MYFVRMCALIFVVLSPSSSLVWPCPFGWHLFKWTLIYGPSVSRLRSLARSWLHKARATTHTHTHTLGRMCAGHKHFLILFIVYFLSATILVDPHNDTIGGGFSILPSFSLCLFILFILSVLPFFLSFVLSVAFFLVFLCYHFLFHLSPPLVFICPKSLEWSALT